MAKPEWGTKRTCQSCGTKFYDLLRDPILCPSCGARFDPEALLKSRRTRSETPKPVAKPVPESTESEELAGDDDVEEASDDSDVEDDALLEDADDLGDDDEITKVVASDDEQES